MRSMEFRSAEMDAIAQPDSRSAEDREDAQGPQNQFGRATLISISPPCPRRCWCSSRSNCRIRARFRRFATTCKSGGRCGWRFPSRELDALGVPRGPKFDKIIEQIFDMQLRGKARTPEDRTKALRNLAGIKEEPKKKEEKEKKKRKGNEAAPRRKRPTRRVAKARRQAPAASTSQAPRAPAKTAPSSAKPAQSAAAAIGARAQAKHDDAAKAHHAAHKHAPSARSKPKARAAKKSRGR